jgi:hypothetical protein
VAFYVKKHNMGSEDNGIQFGVRALHERACVGVIFDILGEFSALSRGFDAILNFKTRNT